MGLAMSDLDVQRDIADQGFAWLPRAAWLIGPDLRPRWQRLCEDWDHLELDRYLPLSPLRLSPAREEVTDRCPAVAGERGRGEGAAKFRLRRYGRYYWSPANDVLAALPQEPYFQPEDENPYAGGIVRHFPPLLPDTVHNPCLHALVRSTFSCLPVSRDRREATWEARIHQIRIVASVEEPGFPAPEGIHQDGTDFLTLHLVRRHNVVGGETTIYDLDRKPIRRHTMLETLDSLILEDRRIMHGVTPVYPADGRTLGIRDLLGVDFIYSPDLREPV
jgi:hypothetical protein